MLKEFREFAMRGNVVDMAVGLIIGAAFGAIVTSLVNDVIMPPIGMVLGGADFSELYVLLKEGTTRRPIRDAGSREGRQGRDDQHWPVRQHGHLVRHRGLRGVHGGEVGERRAPRARSGARRAARADAAGEAAGGDS